MRPVPWCTATPAGRPPTCTVPMILRDAPSTTETVPLFAFVTYTRSSASWTATPTGPPFCATVPDTTLNWLSITDTEPPTAPAWVASPLLATYTRPAVGFTAIPLGRAPTATVV